MADISTLARVLNGALRNVDLSSNTIVVSSIKVGGLVSNTELTKTILDRLVSLQNGTDVDATYHTHDGRYYTKTEIGSTGATSGASLVGVNGTPTHYSPSANNVQKHLEAIDAVLGSAATALDGTFTINNTADPTKKIAFSAAGITAGQTRTITMADANVNLADVNNAILRNGTRAFTAAQSMGGFNLTNLADPVSSQDAVTLAYMNARLNGLTPKAPVVAATTANITLSGTQTIDTVAVVAGNRVLVKNQSTASQNGIYVVAAGAWSRAADMDSLTPFDEFNGAWVTVQQGSQAGQVFVQYGNVTTVGTDPVTFAFYNPIAGLIGGDMITFSGSTFSVDLATVSGLESTNPGNVAGQLRVKLEASNPTLQIDGSNQLGVKLNASGAITASGSGIGVAVDNSTIEINSNALRIKASGVTANEIAPTAVTAAKVNTNVFDQTTITGGAGTAAAVQYAPRSAEVLVAGESFAANTSFLVRWAVNGETAGRVYKADKDASVSDKFYAFGIALSTSAVSAGQNILVTRLGLHTLGSSDSAFSGTDIGKPVFLGSSGAFILGASLTNASNEAQVRIGIVRTTTSIDVSSQLLGVA